LGSGSENVQAAVDATTQAAIRWAGTLAAAVVPNPGGILDSAVDAVRAVVREILNLFGLSNDLMMEFYFDLNQSMDSSVNLVAWDWGTGWDAGYPESRGANQLALRKTEKRHGGEWEVTFLVKRTCAVAGAGTGTSTDSGN
jgi:hypothetical protein